MTSAAPPRFRPACDGQMVQTAAQRFAVERDRAQRLRPAVCVQVTSMATERGFEIVVPERQEQMAQRIHRRGTPEAATEGGVQALARREARRGFKNSFMPSDDNDAPFV